MKKKKKATESSQETRGLWPQDVPCPLPLPHSHLVFHGDPWAIAKAIQRLAHLSCVTKCNWKPERDGT